MRAAEEAAALPHPLRGLSQEAGMLGSFHSPLLWPESPPPTQVGKDTGLLLTCQRALGDSRGWGFLLRPLPDPSGRQRRPLATRWVCPTGTRTSQHFRDTCCNVESTRASKAKPSTSPGMR